MKKQDIDLERIHKSNFYNFMLACQKKGLSQSTIASGLSFLGMIFDHAVNAGYVPERLQNPFRNQTQLVRSKKLDVLPMHLEQARGLFAEAASEELQLLIAIGHYMGVRVSEAFTLRLEESAGHGSFFSIAEGKTGKTLSATRHVPVSKGLQEVLDGCSHRFRPNGLIQWESTTADALSKKFGRFKSKYFDARGITHRNVLVDHSFRHAFSSYLANGFGELKAATLAGHKASNVGQTELGRTYYGGCSWGEKQEMVGMTLFPGCKQSPDSPVRGR